MSAPTPSAVGNKFVVSYYTQLNQNPGSLRHFYKENAVLTHGSESSFGASEETVTGVEEINQKIQKLDFRDCHVTLSVVDCQASHNGVLVLVVGHLSNKAEPPRKFVQSFFLAEQNKAYFVLNDVFRFVEEPKPQDHPAPAQEQPKEEAAQQPVAQEPVAQQPEPVESKPKEKPSVPAPSAPVAAAPVESQASPKEQAAPAEPVKAAAAPPAKQASPAPSQAKRESPKATAAPAKKVTAAPPPPQEEKPQPTGPKSWSNIVGGASAVVQSPPPVEAQPAQAQKKSTPQQPQKQPRREKAEDKTGTTSLFVNNVPFSVTEDQMRAVFHQFGEIKAVTIVSSKGFVFLEYATVEQAQKAIDGGKNGQLSIEGRVLTVVESKKEKKGGSSKDKGSRPPREGREKGDRVESKGERRERGGERGERASNGKQSAAKQ